MIMAELTLRPASKRRCVDTITVSSPLIAKALRLFRAKPLPAKP
jgi:hypothetical protein